MIHSTRLARTLITASSQHLKHQKARHLACAIPSNDQRRNVQTTTTVKKSAVEATVTGETKKVEVTPILSTGTDFMSRFKVTGEVIVSKIFPAGFGWQSSSIVAENYLGYAPETLNFALTTGFGDAVGVLAGHCGFYAIKKAVTSDSTILMKQELDTGILLASAAFCSGTLWQPLVNVLQGANLPFQGVFAGTWIGCGTAFYLGLRAGRTILPGFLEYVEEPTYENSKNDASLSIAIGGATGFFVGTDAAYLPEQNFLIDAVGITDGTPDLTGCAIAGTSTSLGFGAAQSFLNVAYPKDKCWND